MALDLAEIRFDAHANSECETPEVSRAKRDEQERTTGCARGDLSGIIGAQSKYPMKKLLVIVLFLFVIIGAYLVSNFSFDRPNNAKAAKTPILKVALIGDSENENDLLAKGLAQAKEKKLDFVIGMGDFTSLGEKQDLEKVKNVFDASGLTYYLTPGDRDLWDSRNKYGSASEETGEQSVEISYGEAQSAGLAKTGPLENYLSVFGKPGTVFVEKGIRFVIVNNSDLYNGIDKQDWEMLKGISNFKLVSRFLSGKQISDSDTSGSPVMSDSPRLTFVFAHQTPYHPDSKHIMGREDEKVANQAKEFMALMEKPTPCHSEFNVRPAGNSDTISESNGGKILKPFGFAQGEQVQDDKKENVQDDKGAKMCPAVDGFFSGDMHFFANFPSKGESTSGGNSPSGSVRITTIGAASSKRNFQGPRYAILTVYEDYTWEVEDIEIR